MTASSIRLWSIVHRWTSLAATLFLLLLCLTGLPLIFHHEIDEALGYAPRPERPARPSQRATIDDIARAALADHPGSVLQYVAWDRDDRKIVTAYLNHAVNGRPDDAVVEAYSAFAARPLGAVGTGPMLIVLKLHTDMFAGLAGKLFLGAMGLLFLAAIVSGIVLYWPFTRRLDFGTIRSGASRRISWLDWHNLIGIVTVAWAVVVGSTGVINTWAEPMLDHWRTDTLAGMAAPYAGRPAPRQLASLDLVLSRAAEAAPAMEPDFIAFPGTPFTSSHHYAVFMHGDTPLMSRLLKPVLLDGETGDVASTAELPIYLKALFISQPLHFGDYAGTPLKIIWVLLDLATIVVIASGFYLWIARELRKHNRRHSPAYAAGASG
ncbi:MAG: PepSY domain-containing protein [Bradyrhizobium sp.]|nr:PepSY domain-containing protein [Bradyrhizobium sp.]